MNKISLKKIPVPQKETAVPILLSDATMVQRKAAIRAKMKEYGYDSLVIYADVEHGGNFEYFTGFIPRFEEALLVLQLDEKDYLLLGNENLKMAAHARLTTEVIHVPHFSLPNQPMATDKGITQLLEESGIKKSKKIGLVGWKNFSSSVEDNLQLFDLPYYIVSSLKELCSDAVIENAARLLIGENGIRTTNNANEIAHYEFGAILAGNGILSAMEHLSIGISEMELAGFLSSSGQQHNVVTIMSTGERFKQANIYPGNQQITLGDRIAMTVGYKGGLQSRSGYAVEEENQLPEKEKDYLERVAKPYFSTVKSWLERISIGMTGNELYEYIEAIFPKEKYGWTLNPGHLTAEEEWMASPVYKNSSETLKSGMLLQIDLIPSVAGYSGASCESGIVLADSELREQMQQEYPEMWQRFEERRAFISNQLGIKLSKEILPTSSATVYYRPLFLNKAAALVSE